MLQTLTPHESTSHKLYKYSIRGIKTPTACHGTQVRNLLHSCSLGRSSGLNLRLAIVVTRPATQGFFCTFERLFWEQQPLSVQARKEIPSGFGP